MRMIAALRYRIAWWRWFLHHDVMPTQPWLGKTREERDRNIKYVAEQHDKREPRREDF